MKEKTTPSFDKANREILEEIRDEVTQTLSESAVNISLNAFPHGDEAQFDSPIEALFYFAFLKELVLTKYLDYHAPRNFYCHLPTEPYLGFDLTISTAQLYRNKKRLFFSIYCLPHRTQQLQTILLYALHGQPQDIAMREESKIEMCIWPQYKIACGGEIYYVDFLVSIIDTNESLYRAHFGDLEEYKEIKRLCIEIDGHDFHEKTKEQAAKDKKRDRKIKKAGYGILHFTGSEVYKDPLSVWAEIFGHLAPMQTTRMTKAG